MLIFRDNNLNLVAAMQYGIEGNDLAVYLCTDTMKSNFTMNFKCKINWCRFYWESLKITFWCKDIDFILIEIQFEVFKQIFSSFIFRDIFKYISYPVNPVFKVLSRCSFILFVSPMCSYPFFSNFIHFFCSYLNFNEPSFRSYYSCMNQLVTICFRNRDIIFQSIRNWSINIVNNAEYGKTIIVIRSIEDDSDCKEIRAFFDFESWYRQYVS